MSFALTENSTLICAHQGSVTLTASQSRLTVSGAKVLVDGDLSLAPVSAQCAITPSSPPAPVSIKCNLVTSVTGGVAGKLKVQGKGVLLDNVAIGTNGMISNAPVPPATIPGIVQAAGETKLKAI
jgi:hypothetical protein